MCMEDDRTLPESEETWFGRTCNAGRRCGLYHKRSFIEVPIVLSLESCLRIRVGLAMYKQVSKENDTISHAIIALIPCLVNGRISV